MGRTPRCLSHKRLINNRIVEPHLTRNPAHGPQFNRQSVRARGQAFYGVHGYVEKGCGACRWKGEGFDCGRGGIEGDGEVDTSSGEKEGVYRYAGASKWNR